MLHWNLTESSGCLYVTCCTRRSKYLADSACVWHSERTVFENVVPQKMSSVYLVRADMLWIHSENSWSSFFSSVIGWALETNCSGKKTKNKPKKKLLNISDAHFSNGYTVDRKLGLRLGFIGQQKKTKLPQYNVSREKMAKTTRKTQPTLYQLTLPPFNHCPQGMGVSTVSAARILRGQLEGASGEETMLAMDTFPYVALSKVTTQSRWPCST